MTKGQRTAMTLGGICAVIALLLIVFMALQRGQQGAEKLTPEQYIVMMERKLTDLQKVAAADPQDIMARNALGDMYFYLERFTEAERTWMESLAINPDQPMVWSMVGESRVRTNGQNGYPPYAVEAFQEALARNPDDDRARFYMAMHAANQGNFDGALTDLRDISAGAVPESISKTAAERGILEITAKRGL